MKHQKRKQTNSNKKSSKKESNNNTENCILGFFFNFALISFAFYFVIVMQ